MTDISRFVAPIARDGATALDEIRAGRKESEGYPPCRHTLARLGVT